LIEILLSKNLSKFIPYPIENRFIPFYYYLSAYFYRRGIILSDSALKEVLGNKRTALVSALIFLAMNNRPFDNI
jgi:hypothetical protein